jgi:hypothetical protein
MLAQNYSSRTANLHNITCLRDIHVRVAIASTYKQVAQAQVLKPVVDFLNFSFF